MAHLTKHLLSEIESTSGRRFVITSNTASGANVFHVTPKNRNLDELWVYAHNFGASDVQATFLWGLTSMPSGSAADVYDGVDITIPFKSGRALIFDGVVLYGGLSAGVYADVPATISIDGFVNRITTDT
jgi:hypothetical protein